MAIEQVDPMLARLEALEAEVAELRGGQAQQPTAPEPEPESKRPVSRRRLMGMAGAAAAGAVGATALSASPAGAVPGSADGHNFTIGEANGCASTTSVLATSGLTGLKGETLAGSGAGVEGVCNGALGNGVKGTSTTGNGVNGVSSATNGVIGTGPLNGVAGIGTGLNSPGVRGQNANGYDAIGVVGEAATGLGLWGTGGRAQLYLSPNGSVGAPTANLHAKGEFFVDANGVLFYNTADGTPGKWVRQAPLVPLESPVRVYYSLTFPDPPLGSGLERSVKVTNGGTIPHTASAVLTNLAVTPAGADGFLAMFKDGTVWPGTSNVNFTAGQFASNNATSAVETGSGEGFVRIRCGGASVHFVVDVFGYYP